MRKPSTSTLSYTYEDLATLPEDNLRHEILDGELIMTPAPYTRHQRVLQNLNRIVDPYVCAQGLGLVLVAPVDVRFDETNVVQPDLLFVSVARSSIVKEECIRGAPDLVVEVLSKGTRKRDLVTKRKLYERFLVKHYWILDPFEERLLEYVRRGKGFVLRSKLLGSRATFAPACFPGLVVDLALLWV